MYSNTLAPALVPRTTWPNRIERFPMDLGERGGREGGREGEREGERGVSLGSMLLCIILPLNGLCGH